jgi:hypothetical protein
MRGPAAPHSHSRARLALSCAPHFAMLGTEKAEPREVVSVHYRTEARNELGRALSATSARIALFDR